MSPQGFDIYIENILQTPIPDTKVTKKSFTPKQLRFKRQDTDEILKAVKEAKSMM